MVEPTRPAVVVCLRIVVIVDAIGFEPEGDDTKVGPDTRNLRARLRFKEIWNGDRGENGNDGDNYQQFDQGEAATKAWPNRKKIASGAPVG